MQRYKVELPDKRVMTIEAPDEATAIADADAWFAQNGGKSTAQPETSATGAAARGALQGLTFGFSDEIGAGIGAAYDKLTGAGDFGDSYNKRVAENRQMLEASSQQHPWASIGGEIAGSFAVPFGLARAGIGTAANVGQMGLRQAMGRGAAEGAAYGAAYGAGKSEGGLQNRAEGAAGGAMFGGAVGAAAPPVIRGAQALMEGPVNAARAVINPEAEAARRILMAQQADDVAHQAGQAVMGHANPQRVADAQALINTGRAGGELRNIDMLGGGENVRALARSAANNSPQAREIMSRMTNERFEGQAGRFLDFLRQSGGATGNAARFGRNLEETYRAVNRQNYNAAYQAGDRPIISDTIERLTGAPLFRQAMQRAEQSGKNRAVAEGAGAFNTRVELDPSGRVRFFNGPEGVPTFPNLAYWDAVKKQLDDVANVARRQGANDEASVAGEMARTLRDELGRIVPQYNRARGMAASWFGAEDAVDAGRMFARGGAQYNAQEAAEVVRRMGATERRFFREGYVDEIINQVARSPDRRNYVAQIANSPDARERMMLALGPNRAREVEAFLYIEQLMDLPRHAMGNSTTARQLMELGLAGGSGLLAGGGNPFDPQAMITAGLVYGAARGKAHVQQDMARRIAEMLVSNNPAQVQRAARQIAGTPMLGNLREYVSALGRGGSSLGVGYSAAQEGDQ